MKPLNKIIDYPSKFQNYNAVNLSSLKMYDCLSISKPLMIPPPPPPSQTPNELARPQQKKSET